MNLFCWVLLAAGVSWFASVIWAVVASIGHWWRGDPPGSTFLELE